MVTVVATLAVWIFDEVAPALCTAATGSEETVTAGAQQPAAAAAAPALRASTLSRSAAERPHWYAAAAFTLVTSGTHSRVSRTDDPLRDSSSPTTRMEDGYGRVKVATEKGADACESSLPVRPECSGRRPCGGWVRAAIRSPAS